MFFPYKINKNNQPKSERQNKIVTITDYKINCDLYPQFIMTRHLILCFNKILFSTVFFNLYKNTIFVNFSTKYVDVKQNKLENFFHILKLDSFIMMLMMIWIKFNSYTHK